MTTESRNRAINLLAAGLTVRRTAQALGVDTLDISAVEEEWAGLILEKRHGLSGRRFDGTPMRNPPTGGGSERERLRKIASETRQIVRELTEELEAYIHD